MHVTSAAIVLGLMLVWACDPASADPLSGLVEVGEDPVGTRVADLEPAWSDRFDAGDALFERPMREPSGLGPVYIRQSCASCHKGDLRGPGTVTKMAVLGDDTAMLPYGNTVRPYVAGGGSTPIGPPEGDPSVVTSRRMGPSVLGMGFLEAVAPEEIQRVADEQAADDDGVAGRIHLVPWHSEANPDARFHAYGPGDEGLVGRFGLKARIATVDEFVADAFQGDMSITSPLRPHELPNPDGALDDARPGVDIDADTVNLVADYVRMLAIPARAPSEEGEAVFADIGCATCHVPSLRTREDYPIPVLAGVEAPVYTDLLLHDMGDALADGVRDGEADGRSWRTAPLIGLRFQRAYMHDGRAADVLDAILAHESPGSEANVALAAFSELDADDRDALVAFVESR